MCRYLLIFSLLYLIEGDSIFSHNTRIVQAKIFLLKNFMLNNFVFLIFDVNSTFSFQAARSDRNASDNKCKFKKRNIEKFPHRQPWNHSWLLFYAFACHICGRYQDLGNLSLGFVWNGLLVMLCKFALLLCEILIQIRGPLLHNL